MNFKTRVRSLQKTTGWAYQKCLQALRNAGSAPAELAKALGCSLLRADVLTVAPSFDVEHALMLAKTKPSRRKEPDSVAKVMTGRVNPMDHLDARGKIAGLVNPMDQLDDKIAKVMRGLVGPMDHLDDKIAKVMRGLAGPMDHLDDKIAKVMRGLAGPMDHLDDKIAKVMRGLAGPMDHLDDKIAKVMRGRVGPMDHLAARGALARLGDPMGKTRW